MMADDVVFTMMATGDETRGPEAVLQMLHWFYHVAFDARAETTSKIVSNGQAVIEAEVVGEAKRKHSFVSMADVAAFGTACVDNPAARNAYLPIGGPTALSWREIVAMCGQAVGRDLPVQFVAVGEPVPGVPEAAQQLIWGLESYDSVVDMEDTACTFGVELTPLEVVAKRMFGGAGS